MTLIAIIITSILAALLLVQVYLAAGFVRRANSLKQGPLSDEQYPKVALIICVRGNDPTLESCLRSALSQNYPNYGVHVIVDSESDPAWPVVNEIVQNSVHKNVTVQVLAQPLESCSLKCSSLIQVISSLDLSYEVIALLDIDVVPHPCWLRGLVTPLSDPTVGATTGNRWFSPQPPTLANLARHAWNAGAVVMMYWFGIAWGGSLAIKRSAINRGGLLECWSRSFGEDTSINPALRQLGLRLQFVPSAVLQGNGNPGLKEVAAWVARQLLTTRLGHPNWWGVVLHSAGTTLVLILGFVVLGVGLAIQQWDAVIPVATGLVAYLGTMTTLLAWRQSTATEFVERKGTEARIQSRPVSPYKLLAAIVFSHCIYAWALLRASFARTVEWRGVLYHVRDASHIHMVKYRPLSDVRHHPSA